MSGLTPAEREMAELLVQSLNLESVDLASVNAEAPLFGSHEKGWGLDSIDALEIALGVQQKYGVEIKADNEATKSAFANLRRLTEYVASLKA